MTPTDFLPIATGIISLLMTILLGMVAYWVKSADSRTRNLEAICGEINQRLPRHEERITDLRADMTSVEQRILRLEDHRNGNAFFQPRNPIG